MRLLSSGNGNRSRLDSTFFTGAGKVLAHCALSLLLGMAACAEAEVAQPVAPPPRLQQPEKPPSVMATPARLLRAPTLAQLAAYSCSLGVTDAQERLDCITAFGPPPPYAQLTFQVGTTLTVHNPRATPMPISTMRILLKLFPGEKDETIASICLRMCPLTEQGCTGSVAPDACSSSDGPVLRAEPAIARAIPGLILGPTPQTIATELHKSAVAPNGDLTLDLQFDVGSDQLLQHLTPVLRQRMKAKSPPELKEFQLPISTEGGVFVRTVDPSGPTPRIGAWFGPLPGLLPL